MSCAARASGATSPTFIDKARSKRRACYRRGGPMRWQDRHALPLARQQVWQTRYQRLPPLRPSSKVTKAVAPATHSMDVTGFSRT